MASARDLKRKIRSISNTRKITHTMELVATSKAKRAQDRVKATTPYSAKLRDLLVNLARAGTVAHPLLAAEEDVRRLALLVVTGNRGLCGGYNSNALGLAERVLARERREGRDVDIYMVGRKGVGRLRFLKIDVKESYTHFDDRPSFRDASSIAEEFLARFLSGEVQKVTAVSTRYLSAGKQAPDEVQILPIESPRAEEGDAGRNVEFIFEPDPAALLEAVLPLSVRNIVYRLLVEAVASEQIARRMAMKRATDSADEMIESYTRLYNRSRQAGITQQINEIVSGASALE